MSKTASLRHEKHYYREGYHHIFGLDEAGRGPWAGPVAAAAVCLPITDYKLSLTLDGVRDSKDMSANQRDKTVAIIKGAAIAWGIGAATVDEINDIANMTQATKLAMKRALDAAVEQSGIHPDCLFLDYHLWAEMGHIPQVSIVGGDMQSLSIAAASVLAKTWRDSVMVKYAEQYPEYGFEAHKGYGTAQHRQALKLHGVTPIHRRNYAPIRKLLNA